MDMTREDTMTTSPYQVWSIDREKQRALVVDEGDRQYCVLSAVRRIAAADKYTLPTVFEALPAGSEPQW
jgi:hypothetical protein